MTFLDLDFFSPFFMINIVGNLRFYWQFKSHQPLGLPQPDLPKQEVYVMNVRTQKYRRLFIVSSYDMNFRTVKPSQNGIWYFMLTLSNTWKPSHRSSLLRIFGGFSFKHKFRFRLASIIDAKIQYKDKFKTGNASFTGLSSDETLFFDEFSFVKEFLVIDTTDWLT